MTTRKKDQNTSRILTVVIHLLLLLLAFIPVFQHFSEPPIETMVIQFALEEEQEPSADESGALNTESPQAPAESSVPTVSATLNEKPSSTSTKKSVTQEVSEVSEKPSVVAEKEVVRDFGGLFKDDSDVPGSDEGGRDLSDLSSISSVAGKGQPGLNGRSVVFAPLIEDDSQKTGRVVVDVCVNSEGIVTSASYTQKGSTTNDPYLVDKAEESAKKWRFSTSEEPRQCGVITIDFYLK